MKFYNLSEADVLNLKSEEKTVVMRFLCYGDDRPNRLCEIFVRDVQKIVVDAEISEKSEIVQRMEMESDDGELLSFEVNEEFVFLLIEWNFYQKGRQDIMRTYRIYGSGVEYYELFEHALDSEAKSS